MAKSNQENKLHTEEANLDELADNILSIDQHILVEDLLQTQKALQLALEAARMGIWDWDLQTNKIIWSEMLESLYGLTPGEFERVYGGNLEGFRKLIYLEDRNLLTTAVAKALKDKTYYNIEFRVVWPDGSIHWLSGQGRGTYDAKGNPLRMIGIGMDITERKQAEEKLRRSERLKQEIFESSADALFLINAKNNLIEDYNQQAVHLFGFNDKQELVGRQIGSLQKHRFSKDQLRRILRQLYENKFWTTELEYISKTGREFWGHAAISLVNVDSLQYYLVKVRDITERKKAEEEIARNQRELLLEKQRTEEALVIIEKDNLRKTKELEEARALQMSMLPQHPPDLKNLDIAMYMKTSAEVGGDYYDYKIDEEGTLTIIIGDATGHGLKSGIVVATVKSYFQTLANQCTVSELLGRISEGIQNLQVRGMYMGVTVIKIKQQYMSIASSGMPPLYLYQHASKTVEQIVLKGLFLGSSIPFPYQYTSILLQRDDVLLAMTDGLPELFDSNRHMLDYSRIESCFKEAAHLSAEQIIASINGMARQWATDNEDDITLITIKAR